MSLGLQLLLAGVGIAAFGIWWTIRAKPRTKEIRKRRERRAEEQWTDSGKGEGGGDSFGTTSHSHATPMEGEGGDFGGGGASGDWGDDGGDGGDD